MKQGKEICAPFAADQEAIYVFLDFVDFAFAIWPIKENYQALKRLLGRKRVWKTEFPIC